MRDNAIELLEFLGLADKHDAKASDLPYGEQRKLEMARALATRPRLLLLDEPAAGMNPRETDELDQIITRIRDRGITIVLVEHDMRLVMGISDRVTVLNFGTKIAEGPPKEIQRRSGGDRGLSRRGRAAMTMLAIKDLRSGYGKIEVLHDVDLDDRARPDRHADRRQRRGQDDAAENHLRADPPDCGHDRRSTAKASRAGRRTRSSGWASARCRKAAPSSSA